MEGVSHAGDFLMREPVTDSTCRPSAAKRLTVTGPENAHATGGSCGDKHPLPPLCGC